MNTETKVEDSVLPTIEEVLMWVRSKNGVILKDGVVQGLRVTLLRAVLPVSNGSTKLNQTSNLIKETINAFYPNVEPQMLQKSSCVVNVINQDRKMQVWVLESNLILKDETATMDPQNKRLDFPSYRNAYIGARKLVLMGVPDVMVQT